MAVGRLETEGHQPENGFVSCEATSAGTLSRIDCSVLPFLGGFGKYQKRLIVLTWIPALFIGFSQFSDYFLLALPNITCVQPTNASNLTGISYSLFNSSTSFPVPDISANDTINASNKNSSIQCMCKELKYELETGLKHNVVTKWNLVCDSASKVHIAKFSLLVGSIFGYLVMGVLADWFGRHPVLLTSVFFMLVFGLAVAFSVDVTMFSTLRFFEGFCLAGITLSLYVLRIELCLPRYRFSMTMVASFVMLGGQLLMPGLAALCRDWKVLQVVIVCPLILMLFYTWVFPESLRWLLATQQYWRSKALMYRIAKKNQVDMEAGESEVLAELQTVLQNKPKKTCIVKMVGTRNLWKNIVVLCVNSLTGYGIHHCFARSLRDPEANETTVFHSFYADYYTMAGVAVSACVALCPAVVLLGRRGGLLMFMIITALASLLQLGLLNLLGKYSLHLNIERSDTLNKNFSMAFSVIGMFSSHAVSNLSIFFCAEVTPTAIRGGGLGLVLASAGFGMLTAPIMELHNQKGYFLHHIIFACCTLICIICILLLPEPRDQPLPEAIADGENYTRQPLLPARRPGEQRRLLSRSQSREYTPLHQIATSAASTSVTDSASRPPPVADSAEDSAVPHSTESITLLTTASVISTRDPALPHSTDSTVPVAIDSSIPPTTESITPVAVEQYVPSPTGSIVPIAVEPIPATIDSVAPIVVEPVPSNTGSVAPIVIEPVPPTTSSIVPIDVEQIPSTTCSIVPNVVETSPSTTDSIAPIVVEPVPTTTSSIVTNVVESVPDITGAIAPIVAEPIPPTTGPTAPMVVDSINPPTTNSTTLPPMVSAVTPIRDSISFPTTDSTSMGTVEDSSASPTTEDNIPMTTDSTVLLTTDSVNFIPTDAIGTPVTDLVFLPAKDLPFPIPEDSIAPCDINLAASPVTDTIVSPTIESSSPAPSGSSVLCFSDSATPTAAKDSVVQPANGSAAPLASSSCGGPLTTDCTMSPTTYVISPSCTEDSTDPSVKDVVTAEISPSNTVKS